MKRAIRVYFVDDHPVVLRGLEQFFSTVDDVEVVGGARNGQEFWCRFAAGELAAIDVLVLDVDLPGLDGVRLFEQVHAARPELPVLFYTRQPEDQFAVHLLRRGAAGFLSKDRDTDELVLAIRAVHGGRVHATAELTRLLVAGDGGGAPHERLSPRERAVFDLLVRGRQPGEIAGALDVTPSTVSSYLKRIREKLGVASTPEIVQYAYRHKLVV